MQINKPGFFCSCSWPCFEEGEGPFATVAPVVENSEKSLHFSKMKCMERRCFRGITTEIRFFEGFKVLDDFPKPSF